MRGVASTLGLLAVVALLLPVAARADTIDITNHFGTVTVDLSGIVSKQSELWTFNGIQAGKGHSLGFVSFTTGAFITASGNIWTGGQFSSVGSSFIVKSNGAFGQPKGVIFNGAFEGPIDWTLVASNRQFHEYQLTGTLKGQLWNGHMATGTTTQTIYTYWNQMKVDHEGLINLGGTHINSTPEPGTLGLLGTGLVAVAAALRRKRIAS
jgi:PEP-CTERM motif